MAREYARKYYAENPTKYRALAKTRRLKNPEKAIASQKRWRATNPELVRKQRKAWAAANKAKRMAGWRRWIAAHPEKNRAKARAWAIANPERYKAQGWNKRARLRAAPGSYTAAEWRECVERFDGACFYCGARPPLTVDHLVALSRGGSNDIGNIVPACPRCNSSKRASDVRVWLARMLAEGMALTTRARALLDEAAV